MRCKDCCNAMKMVSDSYTCIPCETVESVCTGTYAKKSSKPGNLMTEMINIDRKMPNKIRQDTILIYMDVVGTKIFKKRNRMSLIVKCMYEAYRQNNIMKDIILMGMKFGCTAVNMKNAQYLFSEMLFNKGFIHKYPVRYATCEDLLEDYIFLGIVHADMKDVILNTICLVSQKYEYFSRRQPRAIVLTIAYSFQDTDESPEEFAKKYSIHKEPMKKVLKIIPKLGI